MSIKQQPLIPILFYPLKVLFVDDNIDLIKSYHSTFSEKLNMSTTTSPTEALSILKNCERPNLPFFNNLSNKRLSLTDDIEESYIPYILENIRNFLNNENKFDFYDILITDYDMPELNGIELCNNIKDMSIIKILLTGKYDFSNAIKALNNNIIDCYIDKGADNTIEQINFYIASLTYKYFINLTTQICNFIGHRELEFLFDADFAELINTQINKLSITKYYMISESGSFLLINNDNKFVLAVYTDNQLDEFCEIFENEPSINEVIHSIKTREFIPFFGLGNSPETIAFENWKNIIFKANKYSNYFWSLIPVLSN